MVFLFFERALKGFVIQNERCECNTQIKSIDDSQLSDLMKRTQSNTTGRRQIERKKKKKKICIKYRCLQKILKKNK